MGSGAVPSPAATDNTVVRHTYDRLAGAYDRLVAPIEAGTHDRAIDALAPAAGACVLDVGCGPGRTLGPLADRVGPDGTVIGVDAAAGMTRRARTRTRTREHEHERGVVTVGRGDARSLPIATDAVDAVYCADVLEVFSRQEALAVLTEIDRVLAPDGRCCVVTMDRRPGGAFLRAYAAAVRLPGAARIGCRPIDARDWLVAAGFTIERSFVHRRVGVWPATVFVLRSDETVE